MIDNPDKYITVLTFSYPHEVAVIRGRLESEGIECFVKDELTVQINPFYSNAIGGVKLQVRSTDFDQAVEILKESGYLNTEDPGPNRMLVKLDQATSAIPLVKDYPLVKRLTVLVAASILLVLIPVLFITWPSGQEKLTSKEWCVSYIEFNGKIYYPNTEEIIKFNGPGFCNEGLVFNANGSVNLPGFRSEKVAGNWKLENNALSIYGTDTFEFVYNGVYEMDFSRAGLILTSTTTTIHCHLDNF